MINLTIDGKAISVTEGTTVLQAAREAGIEIPTLCDHPELTPYGGCRLCLVEVEGARTLQPSCTLPVNNNMIVRTNTDRIKAARKFVLTLIFSERNHFCPYCQVSGGDCELQNAAYDEGMTHWPLQPNWQPYPVDASHPFIILENNRCILCRRCVRACGELIGNYTLGFEERGARSILVADTGVPLGESTCISCGSCVQVCPTGALIDRWSAYQGHDVKFDSTKTICVGCSIGCGLEVFTRDNRLVRVDGDWDHPINEGILCEIGRFEPMTDKCDRIFTPMVRKNGALKAATWDEALSAIATNLSGASGAIAGIISSRQPVEALFKFKHLLGDKLNASLVTSTEEGAFTAASAAFADTLGQPFETKISDLETANGVLLLGVDLVKEHQVAGFFVKRNLAVGTNLVVVDSKENELDKLANKTLKPAGVTYEDVLKGISAAVVKLGLAKAPSKTKKEDLEPISARTKIGTDDYLDAAFILASAVDPVIVYNQQIDLSTLKEFAALIGAKLLSLKGDANSLAASQLGLDKPYKAAEYKAAYIALGDGELTQKMVKELEKIPFKVVQASYASALTAGADVVLPSTTWLEQSGHYITLDGKIQESVKVLEPAEGILTIGETLTKIADKMNTSLDGDCHLTVHKRVAPVELVN